MSYTPKTPGEPRGGRGVFLAITGLIFMLLVGGAVLSLGLYAQLETLRAAFK